MVRQLFTVAKTIDPSSVKEEVVRSVEEKLRPADLTTLGIFDGKRTAVDVGITSQASTRTGDPTEHYAREKYRKYRHIIRNEYPRDGIIWRAAIWTQEGRPGADASSIVEGLATMAGASVPGATKTDVRKRLRHEIGVQIQLRLARMIHACIPAPKGDAALILHGEEDVDEDEIMSTTAAHRATGANTSPAHAQPVSRATEPPA